MFFSERTFRLRTESEELQAIDLGEFSTRCGGENNIPRMIEAFTELKEVIIQIPCSLIQLNYLVHSLIFSPNIEYCAFSCPNWLISLILFHQREEFGTSWWYVFKYPDVRSQFFLVPKRFCLPDPLCKTHKNRMLSCFATRKSMSGGNISLVESDTHRGHNIHNLLYCFGIFLPHKNPFIVLSRTFFHNKWSDKLSLLL